MNDEIETRYVSADHVHGEEPPWVVKGILPVGLTVLAAPSRRGKTRFASELVQAIIPGGVEAISGHTATKPGPVIYWPAEQSPRSWKFKAAWNAGDPPEGWRYWRVYLREDAALLDLCDPATRTELLTDARTIGARAIFLDPWSNLFTGDENDRRAVLEVIRPLHAWAHENEAAIVVVHHTKKQQEHGVALTPDDIRGSGSLANIADGVLVFQAPQDGTVMIDTSFRDHKSREIFWSPPLLGEE